MKKTSKASETIAIKIPSIKIGANTLNTSCGAGSYPWSHSKNLGNMEKNIAKKTINKMIGKKLSNPINNFELRDIKVFVKLI